TNLANTPEEEPYYKVSGGTLAGKDDDQKGGLSWLPEGLDLPNHPFTGDPGSQFIIRDDVGDNQQLEPVAKILIQDVRVLRVVRPGETYTASGTRAEPAAGEIGVAPSDNEKPGYLILEVTPQQAEVLAFIDDPHHQVRVVVRGKDDHDTVSTTGITFQILATDPQWAMPWPQSLTAPKQQTSNRSQSAGNGGATATPAATPGSKSDT
ncbi:MAG: hypothetical protein C4345_10975, partial [Chloroflexota bacterium]